MQNPLLIAPSILSADFARLGEEVRALDAAGADWIHCDVMDGHFVPNISFGPDVVKAIRAHTARALDVHLMIAPADSYLEAFARAGADLITVHAESGPHLHRSLQTVRGLGRQVGVALNPATPLAAVEPVLGLVDLVLIMSVNPGFGGQAFLPDAVGRVAAVRRMARDRGLSPRIEVDGGVGPGNARALYDAGADTLVAGSAVLKDGPGHYRSHIAAIRAAAATTA